MRKVFKLKTYEEFKKTREDAENGKFPVVESYCDKDSGVFNLTLITMYKEDTFKPVSKEAER